MHHDLPRDETKIYPNNMAMGVADHPYKNMA